MLFYLITENILTMFQEHSDIKKIKILKINIWLFNTYCHFLSSRFRV